MPARQRAHARAVPRRLCGRSSHGCMIIQKDASSCSAEQRQAGLEVVDLDPVVAVALPRLAREAVAQVRRGLAAPRDQLLALVLVAQTQRDALGGRVVVPRRGLRLERAEARRRRGAALPRASRRRGRGPAPTAVSHEPLETLRRRRSPPRGAPGCRRCAPSATTANGSDQRSAVIAPRVVQWYERKRSSAPGSCSRRSRARRRASRPPDGCPRAPPRRARRDPRRPASATRAAAS